MLKVTKLSKYFGEQTVLYRISFNLERGNKVALTGFNGSGKTTLLNILAGHDSYSNGVFQMSPKTRIGFVPQDPQGHNDMVVLEFLKTATKKVDDAFLRRIEVMLAGFMLPPEVKEKKIGELSSGQKTKIFLTQVLLQDVDLLLFDEPTNNLDLPALIWLEDYLKQVDAACMIVSHDRAFLDAVTNKVFEIDWHDHTLHISHAKYSDYLREQSKEFTRLNQEHAQQQDEVKRLKKLAVYKQERAIAGSKWKSGDNDRMLQGFKQNQAGRSFKEAKVVYNRIKRMDMIRKPKERNGLSLEIDADTESEARNMMLKDVVCGYTGGFSVGPVSFDIPFGTRICIVGPNGVGKSTILKTITGALAPLSGERSVDSGVRFGNFMQEHESLPKEKTLVGFFKEHMDMDREDIHNHLTHFGFSDIAITAPIKTLSPGGRARLLFAYFSAMRVNTLILDEPTNHLDMEAEQALEEMLATFPGTIITVSHDRRFVESVHFDTVYALSEAGLQKLDDFSVYVQEMEARARKLIRMLGK